MGERSKEIHRGNPMKCLECNSELIVNYRFGKREEIIKHEKDCPKIKRMFENEQD
jgi:hypothetical protein